MLTDSPAASATLERPAATDTVVVPDGDHSGHGHADHPSFHHHHFDDMEQQRETTTLGMWSFLVTELMMFGGLFFAYTLYRWNFHAAYMVGSSHLNVVLGTANTFVLLFSSLTMALGVHAAALRNRKALVGWLLCTLVLGTAFIGIKAKEWTDDYHEGLVPVLSWHPEEWEPKDLASDLVGPELAQNRPELSVSSVAGSPQGLRSAAENANNPGRLGDTFARQVMMYFFLYFCMTGLHAIHMIVGLLVVGTAIIMGSRGAFTNGNDQPVEIVGLYWHFVDIVWVFLFPLLYLVHGFHPGGH